MNPFDPGGALLEAHARMEARQRSAALERMIRCCRKAFSLPARLAAAGSLFRRRRANPACVAC